MKKVNFKKQVFVFGKPAIGDNGPLMLHEEIANGLIMGRSSSPSKMMSICLRLYDFGEAELDEADLAFLKTNIESSSELRDFLVATALEEIENQTR